MHTVLPDIHVTGYYGAWRHYESHSILNNKKGPPMASHLSRKASGVMVLMVRACKPPSWEPSNLGTSPHAYLDFTVTPRCPPPRTWHQAPHAATEPPRSLPSSIPTKRPPPHLDKCKAKRLLALVAARQAPQLRFKNSITDEAS